jgi:hypothetical protein
MLLMDPVEPSMTRKIVIWRRMERQAYRVALVGDILEGQLQ